MKFIENQKKIEKVILDKLLFICWNGQGFYFINWWKYLKRALLIIWSIFIWFIIGILFRSFYSYTEEPWVQEFYISNIILRVNNDNSLDALFTKY